MSEDKESDIPHHTKITECVLDCADAIQKELTKELEVSLLIGLSLLMYPAT
jgi:hypothetical protein